MSEKSFQILLLVVALIACATTLLKPTIGSKPTAAPHNSERIAVTDDGTKVYKVTGPGTVVPVVVAVSPTGHVAVR